MTHFTNSGKLIRLILRRDRLRIPIWILSISLLTIIIANTLSTLYNSETERSLIAETMKNPAMIAMAGPVFDVNNYTTGVLFQQQMFLFTAITVGIMSIFLVTRHTRRDEEAGRIELIRALPTGRLAHLTATIIVISLAHIVLGTLIGVGLYSLSIESINMEGSLLYGAALTVIGIFFTALTALFAQLSESARSTIGLSFTALLLFYLIRAIGDVSNEVLSSISPFRWILNTKVFVDNSWWPLILTLSVSLLLLSIAYYLQATRDLDAGFIPARPGKRHASRLLQSPLGLISRLERTTIISWAIGLFILGLAYGSVFGDLERFFKDSEIMQQLLMMEEGTSLTEEFITLLMKIMAIVSTVPTMLIVLKMISEERKGYTDNILTRAISRNHLLGSSLFLAIIVPIIMLSLTAIGLWAAAATVVDEPVHFITIYQAAIIYLPAVWVMLSVAVLFIGFFPKFTNVVWMYLVYSFIVVYLGSLLQFPDWLENITPYSHIPQLPTESVSFIRLFILLLLTSLLTMIGFIGYNKRDIQG